MQKVFLDTSKLDKKASITHNISSEILMENAAFGISRFLNKKLKNGKKILLVCGKGDNGADSLALARIIQNKYDISILMPFGSKSELNKLQLKRLQNLNLKMIDINALKKMDFDCIIDSIFGSGFNRELDIESIRLIKLMNHKKALKVACDIPSGIDIDGNPYEANEEKIAFKADFTLAMGALKISLLNDNSKDCVGKIKVIQLGVSREFFEEDSNIYLLEKKDLKLPTRNIKNCNKGNFGHLNVFAGEKQGAPIIAAIAGNRTGTGLVSLICNTIPNHTPCEIMVSNCISNNATAIAIGMGYGQNNKISQEIINCDNKIPILLDADIFYNEEFRNIIYNSNKQIVLTPHPKEFIQILKVLENKDITIKELQMHRVKYAMDFSKRYKNTTLVLKGANQIIAREGSIFINPLGLNVLSKGGSGDLLAGIIGGLLAQGYDTLEASIQGSLMQTIISRKAAKKYADFSITPLDLIEQLRYIKKSK